MTHTCCNGTIPSAGSPPPWPQTMPVSSPMLNSTSLLLAPIPVSTPPVADTRCLPHFPLLHPHPSKPLPHPFHTCLSALGP